MVKVTGVDGLGANFVQAVPPPHKHKWLLVKMSGTASGFGTSIHREWYQCNICSKIKTTTPTKKVKGE